MRVPWGTRLASVLALVILAPSTAPGQLRIVEDWAQQVIGARGLPSGWHPYATFGGRPAYDFIVAVENGRRALHLKSHDDHSTIAKNIQVDLRATPILQWDWKLVELPAGADIRHRATSDLSGHILLAWPRPPVLLRTRLIGYAWDTSAPAPSVERSRKTGAVTFIVLRSGRRDLNRWLTERRHVRDDYRQVFGEDPPDPEAVVVSIDTNDTHSRAEAFVGSIVFTKASGEAASATVITPSRR